MATTSTKEANQTSHPDRLHACDGFCIATFALFRFDSRVLTLGPSDLGSPSFAAKLHSAHPTGSRKRTPFQRPTRET